MGLRTHKAAHSCNKQKNHIAPNLPCRIWLIFIGKSGTPFPAISETYRTYANKFLKEILLGQETKGLSLFKDGEKIRGAEIKSRYHSDFVSPMQLKEVFEKYEGNKYFQARVGAKSQRNASFWQKIIIIITNGDIEGQRSIHKLKHNFFVSPHVYAIQRIYLKYIIEKYKGKEEQKH